MHRTTAERVRRAAAHVVTAVRQETGQGTVEYVALILLIATVMTAVVLTKGLNASGIAHTIVDKLKHSIEHVGAT